MADDFGSFNKNAAGFQFLSVKDTAYIKRITDLNLPVNDSDAANKEYVDNNLNTFNRIIVNTNSYTLQEDDDLIGVGYTTTGIVSINLPAINSLTTTKSYTIVDEGGNANTNNITINTNGLDTIIGNSNIVLSENYNAVTIYHNGVSKWFIQ